MNRAHARGFSLIELVITLAIVAILATLTVPSFSGLVARSRRSDAISSLLRMQLAQEYWRAGHFAYAPDLATLGWRSADSAEGFYRLHIDHADAAAYLVTAQPQGGQQDDSCGVFAVDANGPVYGSGFAGVACWRR